MYSHMHTFMERYGHGPQRNCGDTGQADVGSRHRLKPRPGTTAQDDHGDERKEGPHGDAPARPGQLCILGPTRQVIRSGTSAVRRQATLSAYQGNTISQDSRQVDRHKMFRPHHSTKAALG